MNVEDFIESIEADYLESALKTLSKTPKDLVLIYLNALEYKQAKLMRGNTILETENTDKDITIKVVDGNSRNGNV